MYMLCICEHLGRAFWHQGLEYRYAYGVAAKPPCTFANGLGKFDMVTGEATLWHEPGCIPGEPVMVPRPGAQVLSAPLPAIFACIKSQYYHGLFAVNELVVAARPGHGSMATGEAGHVTQSCHRRMRTTAW